MGHREIVEGEGFLYGEEVEEFDGWGRSRRLVDLDLDGRYWGPKSKVPWTSREGQVNEGTGS